MIDGRKPSRKVIFFSDWNYIKTSEGSGQSNVQTKKEQKTSCSPCPAENNLSSSCWKAIVEPFSGCCQAIPLRKPGGCKAVIQLSLQKQSSSCHQSITSTCQNHLLSYNNISNLWFGIVLRKGHIKRVSETSVRQWVSYWKGRAMQWGDSGSMPIPQFSQVYSIHTLYFCEAFISKSTFCFATIQLKAEHDASVSGAAAYQPRAWRRTKTFSLSNSLCVHDQGWRAVSSMNM